MIHYRLEFIYKTCNITVNYEKEYTVNKQFLPALFTNYCTLK